MKVSIVIPTYNEVDVVGECLESLSRQTYKNIEVIVVDDGSTDDTNSKLKNQKSKLQLKNLKLLGQKHAGAGAARNFGVAKAQGDILVFVDADMTFEPDFVQELVEPIVKGKVKGTFSREEYVANPDNIWARLWNINRGLPVDRMHPPNYPKTQKVFRAILKREFEKAGGFDEKAGYTDDWTLADKLGYEAVAAPGAKFYHRNPETLREVFTQACWMGKRRYKLGKFGGIVAIVRASLPISVLIGTMKSVVHRKSIFLPFKITYDFGIFLGAIEFLLGRSHAK